MYIQIALKNNPNINKHPVTSCFNSIEELQIYLNQFQFILVEMYDLNIPSTFCTKALINTNNINHCYIIKESQIGHGTIMLNFLK